MLTKRKYALLIMKCWYKWYSFLTLLEFNFKTLLISVIQFEENGVYTELN